MELNRLDRLAFEATPVITVPRYSPLPALQIGQRRYLVASDGVYIEARSRALHACVQMAGWVAPTPFGEIVPFAKPVAGPIPPPMLQRFMALAAAASPAEAAALIVLRHGRYELIHPGGQQAGVGRISYSTRGIDPLDVLVDMHSHGRMAAFFSTQDDADDLANPSPCFFAMVFGRVDSCRQQIECRTVVNGWAAPDIQQLAEHLAQRPEAFDEEGPG